MRKPLALLVTDTHTKESNIKDVHQVMYLAIVLAKKLKLKKVYHLGDVYDSRKGQTIPNLRAFYDILQIFDEQSMKLIAIPGNHDKTDYESNASFIDPFKNHPALYLYDKPGTTTLIPNNESVKIYMMPFFADQQYLDNISILTDHVDEKFEKRILLTHIGLDGAKMNNGSTIKSRINLQLFSKFDKVFVGHYHDPAVYGNVNYIGAALQHNYGEKPVKGCTVVYDDLSTEFHELDSTRYLAFKINADDFKLSDLADLVDEKANTGHNYRVVLTGSEASIKAFDKQRVLAEGISVATEQSLIQVEDIEEKVEAFTDKSIADAFSSFCIKNRLTEEEGLVYLRKANIA